MPTLPEPPNPLLLAGLRKALSGPRPLSGPGDDPLFPGGKAGKALAELAVKEGYLTTKRVKVQVAGKKAKTVDMAVLTDKGRNYVLVADSPKAILETLVPVVRALSVTPVQTGTSTSVISEVQTATETCRGTIQDASAKLQHAVQKAIEDATAKLQAVIASAVSRLEDSLRGAIESATPSSTPDLGLVVHTLENTLNRVTAAINQAPMAATEPRLASDASHVEQKELEEAIADFVDYWVKEKTVGPQFDTIWNHLRPRFPELTVGAFQDALRKLHSENRVRLGGWPRMLDDLPEPQLALFISSKVMYYAQPSHTTR